MKILYEISRLGSGHINSKSRRGIFRYIESILEELTIRSDIDYKMVSYTQFYNYIFTRQYLSREKPKWSSQLVDISYGKFFPKNYCLTTYHSIQDTKNRNVLNRGKRRIQALSLNIFNFLARPSKIDEFFDIYHSFYDPLPPKSQINAKARIITIYDMIPIIMPEYFDKEYQKKFSKILQSLALNQDWSICISEATKKDFCAYSKMPEERVFVTPLAAHPKFFHEINSSVIEKTCQKYKIPSGQYILGLSTLEPRKNLAFLIKCFYKLLLETDVKDTYLVLVGSKGWLFDDGIFAMAKSQPNLLDKIIFTGYIQDEDLSAIYSGATCFVYPSLYEGFGLPPLEAMQCGVPVITSNTSSLPEVVGDAGIMVDPKDEDSLCQAMLNFLISRSLREDFQQRSLKRAKQFSWEKCADETVKIYLEILERS